MARNDSLGGTVIRLNTEQDDGPVSGKIYFISEEFSIIALGGNDLKKSEMTYVNSGVEVGTTVSKETLMNVWDRLRAATDMNSWQMIKPAVEKRPVSYYCLETMRPVNAPNRGFLTSGQQPKYTDDDDVGYFTVWAKGSAKRDAPLIPIRGPIHLEPETLMQYIGRSLMGIPCTREIAEELIDIYDHIPLTKVVKYSLQIIRARPELIKLTNHTICVDALHVCFAAYLIKKYSIRTGDSKMSGAQYYATQLNLMLTTHLRDRNGPVVAFMHAYKELFMPPTPRILNNLVKYVMSIAGEIEIKCDIGNDYLRTLMKDIPKSRDERFFCNETCEREVNFYNMILDKEVFYFTNTLTGFEVERYITECEKELAPWDAARLSNPADFAAAQNRYYYCLRRTSQINRAIYDNLSGPTMEIETSVPITPGWFASMVGVNVVDPINDIIGCLNFEDLLGTPTIMRGGRQANTDDLSNADKKRYGTMFMEQFKFPGLRFSSVPSSFDMLKELYLRNVNGTPCIYACEKRYDKKVETVSWIKKYECPGGYLQIKIPLSLRPYQAPEIDPRGLTIRAAGAGVGMGATLTGVMSGTTPWLMQEFGNMTRLEKLRAAAIMRNYDDELVVAPEPVLYTEDRKIFRILCELSYRCPSLLERSMCSFTVHNGPILWSILHPLIKNASPVHYPWKIYSTGKLLEFDSSGVTFSARDKPEIKVPGTHDSAGCIWDCYSGVGTAVQECKKNGIPCSTRCRFRGANQDQNRIDNTCLKCRKNEPTLWHYTNRAAREPGCGRVAYCVECGPQQVCGACENSAVEADWKYVHPAPSLKVFFATGTFEIETLPPPLPWQIDSLARLTSFARQTEVIWLSPGAGKTRIIIDYIRWCNDNNCMTKYVMWVAPKVTFANLERQFRMAGIPYVVHEKRDSQLIPGLVNFVATNNFAFMNQTEIAKVADALTFVLDEFHRAMSTGTKISTAAIQLAKTAYRTIPMSGTIYKNSSSYGELSRFLGLCVDFQLNSTNVQVGLGLMCTFKIATKSLIRREARMIKTRGEIAPNEYKQACILLQKGMLEDIKRSVAEEIGVVVTIPTIAEAEAFGDFLWSHGIDALVQNSTRQFTIGHQIAPDPRGPGIIARNRESAQEAQSQTVESSVVVLGDDQPEREFRASSEGRKVRSSLESIYQLCREFEQPHAGTNESYRLPQVIIVPHALAEGYDLNRYRRMFTMVLPTNQSLTEQLEGRICRANNDAPFIEYYAYYLDIHQGLHDAHEVERARSDATRDVQQGDDKYLRKYDAAWYKERMREAEFARERARQAEEEEKRKEGARQRAYSDEQYDGPSARVLAACAFFGIKYVEVPNALLSNVRGPWRKMQLTHHPDRWSGASAEEQEKNSEICKLINRHYDFIVEEVEYLKQKLSGQ